LTVPYLILEHNRWMDLRQPIKAIDKDPKVITISIALDKTCVLVDEIDQAVGWHVRFLRFLTLASLYVLSSSPARAADYPDLVSLGGGVYDFDKEPNDRKSGDYRIEYRWGISLLPQISDRFNGVDSFVQIHPALGFEGNTKGATYGNGGLDLDIPFLHYGIFTWGESLGAFGQGNNVRTLGSIFQFRSQVELGFHFDNDMRVTGFISHISNACILHDDPGAEIAGVYLHVPLSLFAAK